MGSKDGGEGGIIRVIEITLSDVVSSSNLQKHHINDASDAEPSLKGCLAGRNNCLLNILQV